VARLNGAGLAGAVTPNETRKSTAQCSSSLTPEQNQPQRDEAKYDAWLSRSDKKKSAEKAQLILTIKTHIEKGDKATQKANDHYIAAGQHLKTLKNNHGGTWAEWEELLKTKIGIGKSRASELMQIADGTKTVEQTRALANTRKIKHRESLRSGTEKSETAPETSAQVMKAKLALVNDSDADDADEPDDDIEAEIDKEHLKTGFLIRTDQAERFAVYSGPVDAEIVEAVERAAAAWAKLAANIKDRQGDGIPDFLRRRAPEPTTP
jgi:hypothetical protein